jgi:hypothetical protein
LLDDRMASWVRWLASGIKWTGGLVTADDHDNKYIMLLKLLGFGHNRKRMIWMIWMVWMVWSSGRLAPTHNDLRSRPHGSRRVMSVSVSESQRASQGKCSVVPSCCQIYVPSLFRRVKPRNRNGVRAAEPEGE